MCRQYVFVTVALAASLGLVVCGPIDSAEIENEIQETQSRFPFVPNPEDNIRALVGPQEKFVPFCRQARELVLEKVGNEKDRLRTLVFNLLMGTGEKLANEVSSTLSSSVNQLSETLSDPSRPIPEIEDPDEAQRKVLDQAKRIQDGKNWSDLVSSFTTVSSVVYSKAKKVLGEQMSRAKILLQPDSMRLISDACTRLNTDYLDVLQAMFKSHFKDLVKEAKSQNDATTLGFLSYTKQVGQLQCGVVRRLMNLKLFCSVYSPAVPVITQMWTGSDGSDMSEFDEEE